jgi:uncharacterized protein (UPF0332 family)
VTTPNEDVVRHRLQRASNALAEARLLAEHGHTNACVNRLYYACFYAVSALLQSRGLSASKHTGVRSLFGRHFVKTGVVAKELAAVYNELFEYRQGSDYEDFFQVEPNLIPRWLPQVDRFVEALAEATKHPDVL